MTRLSKLGECPICRCDLDYCPHSLTEVDDFKAERELTKKIRKIVQEELAKLT